MEGTIKAHVASNATAYEATPAPTAGEARKEYSDNLLSRFSQIFAQHSNPLSVWLLPGGTGKYIYDANTIQTKSHLQFQDNPILHASIAQMMIEINNIDKALGKTTSIAATAESIASTVDKQTAERLKDLVPAHLSGKPGVSELVAYCAEKVVHGVPDGAVSGILHEAKKQGVITASVAEKQDSTVGFGFESRGSEIQFGFEKESAAKDGAIKFKGNCSPLKQPEISHDMPDPIIRAFSYLAEMLLILLMNAANIRTEVTFNAIAQLYQQRIQEMVTTNPEQAAEYLNKIIFTKDALDPAIQKALQRALGLEGLTQVEAKDLAVSEKGLCHKGVLCKGEVASQVNNLARKEHFKAGGDGSVEFRLVGSEEQLDAVKKMNTNSAPKLETGMELTQSRASITQAPSSIPQNQAAPGRMGQ